VVAHLVRLRLLLLKNSLLRSTWQLIAVIIGGLYGLGMLALLTVGLVALSWTPVEFARTAVVLGGSALILGWIIIPLISTGIDQVLDPSRLITFPIPRRQLLVGLALCGVLGIPGIITTLGAAATAATWWQHPLAAAAALVCAAIGVLTCVVASRAVIALGARLSSGRRFREIGGIVIFIPLVLLGPIIIATTNGIRGAADALPGLASSLAWTPIGAVWAVPSDIAMGDPTAAGLHFAIAAATLAALWLLWGWSIERSLAVAPHTASRRTTTNKLGVFSVVPATPAGAVAARSLTYWFRDPRYLRSLIIVPLVPALFIFYSSIGNSFGMVNAAGPIVAFLLSLSIFSDVSYDSTAFAVHVATGIRGVADRAGRAAALATFAIPAVIVITILSVWVTGSWAMLPGLLGLSLGILLSGLGLSSVTSARVTIPVPAPGDSPFKSPPGAGFTTMITSFATWGILGVLILPELIAAIIGFATGQVLFGWIALVLGIGLGCMFTVIGVRVGGGIFDRRAPELLAGLRKQA
jgi:ABC-2 type transport system permease protein